MNEFALWNEPLFKETFGLIVIFLFIVGFFLFLMRKRSSRFTKAWVSTKSWIFIAPIIFFVIGLPAPYPLLIITLVSVYSAKTFFRMVGMYHRTWFVWLTYFFIYILSAMVYFNETTFFNMMPMLFLLCATFIPILRHSYTHMIQYMALSLICFIFMGWSLMHVGLILSFKKGIYILIYLYLLAEFSFNSSVFFSRFFGKEKLLSKISPKFTFQGLIYSMLVTILLAWAMRHLLPIRKEPYWLASSLIVILLGRSGDIILSVIRRDLGVKDSGLFIIGRDDILSRVDKFIFVAPAFYYVFQYLLVKFPPQ